MFYSTVYQSLKDKLAATSLFEHIGLSRFEKPSLRQLTRQGLPAALLSINRAEWQLQAPPDTGLTGICRLRILVLADATRTSEDDFTQLLETTSQSFDNDELYPGQNVRLAAEASVPGDGLLGHAFELEIKAGR